MFKLGIRRMDVQADLRLGPHTLQKAMDPAECGNVGHDIILRLRAHIEKQLRERGWQGEAKDLWEEYDRTVLERFQEAA